jgi:hypothetical protein
MSGARTLRHSVKLTAITKPPLTKRLGAKFQAQCSYPHTSRCKDVGNFSYPCSLSFQAILSKQFFKLVSSFKNYCMNIIITAEKIKEIAQEVEMGMLCYYHIKTGELETVPDELKGHAGYEEKFWKDGLKKIKDNQKHSAFNSKGVRFFYATFKELKINLTTSYKAIQYS